MAINSSLELARLLREAEAAHHEFEENTGEPDPDWATWYADKLAPELGLAPSYINCEGTYGKA